MTRWFNIAGPCFPDEHYMIPPERRAGEMLTLIEQGRWFTLVSGRQTGKTTVVQWVERTLAGQGRFHVLWVDLQSARDEPDTGKALAVVLHVLMRAVERDLPALERPSPAVIDGWLHVPATALYELLAALCRASSKPLVLLFDEADCLVGAAMVSFLTQLRELYVGRHKQPAPHSVALIGTRAVRDYVLSPEERRALPRLGTSSPFNITVENVSLVPFTEAEVGELVAQHTAETGQRFEPEAIATVFELSQGHPWLVNALADQATRRDVTDRAAPVTAEHIERAKETIILERRTHLDSLAARLREERVRRVLDPMLAGALLSANDIDEDLLYVAGLGLIRRHEGAWRIANPIYREIIPRALTAAIQESLGQSTQWYVRPDGSLDMPKLMGAWQTFWRKDGHIAAQGFGYRESGPHLMLMAFFQRIVNGGGRIEREYALGKGALDLLIEWKGARHVIEVKLRRDTETEDDALEQVTGYLDTLGLREGWLVMFDLRSTQPWDQRLFTRAIERGEHVVRVVGC